MLPFAMKAETERTEHAMSQLLDRARRHPRWSLVILVAAELLAVLAARFVLRAVHAPGVLDTVVFYLLVGGGAFIATLVGPRRSSASPRRPQPLLHAPSQPLWMVGILPLCGVGLWLGGWIANDAYHDSSLGDPLAFLGTALFLVGLAIPWIAYLRRIPTGRG